jgi:hypothetical protein
VPSGGPEDDGGPSESTQTRPPRSSQTT